MRGASQGPVGSVRQKAVVSNTLAEGKDGGRPRWGGATSRRGRRRGVGVEGTAKRRPKIAQSFEGDMKPTLRKAGKVRQVKKQKQKGASGGAIKLWTKTNLSRGAHVNFGRRASRCGRAW